MAKKGGLRIKASEPIVHGDEYDVTVYAYAADGDDIEFIVDGVQYGPTRPVENGRAACEILNLAANKAHDVVVRNAATVETRPLVLPVPKKPSRGKVDKILVRTYGGDGEYQLLVAVASEDGRPIKGISVRWFPEAAPVSGDSGPTEEDGIYKKSITVQERSAEYVVIVDGIHERRLYLYGKPRASAPPPPPSFSPTGIFDAIKRGWRGY